MTFLFLWCYIILHYQPAIF